MEPYPHLTLMTSQRPHLLKPSHWGSRACTWELWGGWDTILSMHPAFPVVINSIIEMPKPESWSRRLTPPSPHLPHSVHFQALSSLSKAYTSNLPYILHHGGHQPRPSHRHQPGPDHSPLHMLTRPFLPFPSTDADRASMTPSAGTRLNAMGSKQPHHPTTTSKTQ